MEAIVAVDLVSAVVFEVVLLAVGALLVGELLLVVEVLFTVGELVVEL